jgi:hypothetical protein
VVEEFKVMGMCNIINTSQSDITISFNAPLINGSSQSTTTSSSSTEVVPAGKSTLITY